MKYTFKQPDKKPTMLQRIRKQYHKLIQKVKRGLITAVGIVATLMALFGGHIFTAIVVGGLTYYFWKHPDGLDRFVGKAKVA